MEDINNYSKLLSDSFPKDFSGDVEKVCNVLDFDSSGLIHSTSLRIKLNGEYIIIPYRLYFKESSEEAIKNLTQIQNTIFCCIFLRHADGFLREKYLLKLLTSPQLDYFTAPFIFGLVGEYIIEILTIIDKNLDDRVLSIGKKFFIENGIFWDKISARVPSYWNEFYRFKYPIYRVYVGKRILIKINRVLINGNI